jgi:hypothetical protein
MVTQTFEDRGDGLGLVLDGTIATTLKSGDISTMATQTTSADITITEGAATVEEHGAYDLLITNKPSRATFELRGDRLTAKMPGHGYARSAARPRAPARRWVVAGSRRNRNSGAAPIATEP